MNQLTRPIVQISLDLTSIDEALDHARKAVRAGVDWLEAGTPLILAEGLRAVRALRSEFPQHPVVADLKTMDGGYLEAEMMAKAGATHVVVMARAHPATLKVVVQAGRDYGVKVMGDDLGCEDKPAAARQMEDLRLPADINYQKITQLSKEAQNKLTKFQPMTLGQASRIAGVSPADITVLMIHLRARLKT